MEILRPAGVPCAPILTIDAVLDEPQTKASGMLVTAPHPRIPDYTSVALPITWNRRRPGVRRVPPALGEHSEDVLTALGYTRDDVRGLRARNVVR
jgi:crotonobetainyl-CoA:carnitine CoA-transferase CaiB-like acyl-CoA transferase